MKKNVFLFAFLNVLTMADFSLCLAAEKDSLPDLSLNIYSNIGLVHDTRAVALKKGENEVSFDGVSALLKPETALLSGENIDVTEQSYDYNILNANNIMDAFVGKEVKTLWQSPETGKLVFDKAVLLNANYGAPILKFDYGIAGGAGLEVRTGIGNFILEGRYYFGLNDFYNNTKRDYFGRSAHATIIGKLTYLFDLTN